MQSDRNLWDFRREFDRFFEDFWGAPSSRGGPAVGSFAPGPVDLEDRGDHFLLQVEMPGIPKENLKVEVNENELTIEGERKGRETKDGVRSRHYGSVRRTVTFPARIDPARVEASLEHGVLEIEAFKAATGGARRIEIGARKKHEVAVEAPADEHRGKIESSGDSERVAS